MTAIVGARKNAAARPTAMPSANSHIEILLSPARHLKGDDSVWQGHHFIWKKAESWTPQLTAWLGPRFRKDAMKRLKPGRFRTFAGMIPIGLVF
jgi:hypothetical protein